MSTSLPSHAYVPGQTQRHSEGTFATIRDTVNNQMSVEELRQSLAFVTGMVYLREGYYWEAHEVLEPVWMAVDENTEEKTLLQALIQLANAQLKFRMNRPKAVVRLCDIVHSLLDEIHSAAVMGVSIEAVRKDVSRVKNLL